MSTLSAILGVRGGGLVPKSIVTETLAPAVSFGDQIVSIRGYKVLSGACTAATLKTILSVTGKGTISKLALAAMDSTSRTHRVKITLDGTVIYDSTSAADATKNVAPIIGDVSYTSFSANFVLDMAERDIFFEKSLLIEYASSLTETDKTKFVYVYYTR